MTVAVVATMPRKEKTPDLSVKVHLDVVKMARILSAINDTSMSDIISDTLRPIFKKLLEQHEKAGGLVPKEHKSK